MEQQIKIEMTEEDVLREHIMSGCAHAALETFRDGMKEEKIDNKHCYGFTLGIDKDEETPTMALIGEGADVYDFLENMPNYYTVAEQVAGCFMLGIFTQGWGAPIGKDEDEDNFVPPSENENRRRVLLVYLVSQTGHTVSAIKIDGDDEIMINFNNAGGQMAEGLARAFARCMATNSEFNSNTKTNEGE